MLKRLQQLFGRKGESPQEREEREKQEILRAMNAHQSGGDYIQEGLEQIDLTNLGSSLQGVLETLDPTMEKPGIPAEKIVMYNRIVSGLQEILEEAPLSTLNTSEIDGCICELVTYFKNAVVRGREASADRLLVEISDGIQYSRAPFREATEERKASELIRRTDRMENITAVAELRDVADQLEESIREISISIEKKQAEQEQARAELKALMEAKENAKEILEIYRNTGDIKDKVFITEYAKHANRVTHVEGDLKKLSLIREQKGINKDRIDHVREMMKIADFMAERPITDQLLNRANRILERNKSEVASQEAQKQYIDEMERKGEAIFDALEQNMLPEIDKIIREYDKSERARERDGVQIVKEKQRIAEEEKEKLKEENVQTDSNRTLLYD